MIQDHRGMAAKPAIKATIERVYAQSGKAFSALSVIFTGATACVRRSVTGAVFIQMPAIDETAQVSRELFNDLIGYSIHELGHLWHTDMDCWTAAVAKHGERVGHLINGLEDPRIEQAVIKAGIAPGAKDLFQGLLNRVLDRSGYVQADDYLNIPFILAVEGRRLNGYKVNVESCVPASVYKDLLVWALDNAKLASCTADIVTIAVELDRRLRRQQQNEPKEPKGPEPRHPKKPKKPDESGEQGDTGEIRKVEMSGVLEEDCSKLSGGASLPVVGEARKIKINWSNY